ncbi:MAG: hydroxymethylglutaryl-CoA lyase [Parahaliea sp.]
MKVSELFQRGGEPVIINEVGPRDGLQNHPRHLTPAQRVRLIESLVAAGVSSLEMGAFVSPKAVPAMAGTDEVFAGLDSNSAGFSVLVPNRKGYELARDAGIATVNLVVAASNSMNKQNIRMSTEQAMAVAHEVIAVAADEAMRTQVYIATAWQCPFEGAVDPGLVLEMTGQLLDWGSDRIVLADTIGAAAPGAVRALVAEAIGEYGAEKFCCHFHDTRAFGVANVYAALEAGARRFDTSVGGLGGCPFAPGASGNVATEDVVLLLEQEGFDTGIDLKALLDSVALAAELTQSSVGGRSYNWLRQQAEKGRL